MQLRRTLRCANSGLGVRMLSALAEIDASRLTTTLSPTTKARVPKEDLVFGATFSDHMLEVDWTSEGGWEAPRIVPYGDISLSPAVSSLHYGLQCFEGMKAYVDDEERVRFFRPEMNMARMNSSMDRLCLPQFNGDELLKCIKTLVKQDSDWIPRGEGFSLYIRPTGISTQPTLGVGRPTQARIFVILSPVGPYYPEGFKPVNLYASRENVRAWPGGTGDTKIGGNYASTISPQTDAASKGYTQVMWLFGPDAEVTEVGTMNVFFVWTTREGKRQLVTAPLDGTILPGVTRSSALELARGWGDLEVVERVFTMGEVTEAIDEGRMLEAFGTGTAAVLSPIASVHFEGRDLNIPLDAEDPDALAGPVAQRMWDEITSIQYGKKESDWSVIVE